MQPEREETVSAASPLSPRGQSEAEHLVHFYLKHGVLVFPSQN